MDMRGDLWKKKLVNCAKVKEIGCEILLLGVAGLAFCERCDEIICFAKAGLQPN